MAHAIRSMLPEDKVGIKTMVSRAPNKGIWIPESAKFLLVESEIRGKFYPGNLETWALESGIELEKSVTPCTHYWNPESMFH